MLLSGGVQTVGHGYWINIYKVTESKGKTVVMSKYDGILGGYSHKPCQTQGHYTLDLLFKLTAAAPAGLHSPQGLAIMQKCSF